MASKNMLLKEVVALRTEMEKWKKRCEGEKEQCRCLGRKIKEAKDEL